MRVFIGFLFLIVSIQAFTQGCSDAGFCTMGAMRPDQNFSRNIQFKLRSVSLQYYKGQSTLTPVIDAYTLELNFGLNELTGIQVKIPYQSITGTLTRLGDSQDVPIRGLGDISLSYTRTFIRNQKFDLSGTLGVKIPTNNSDAKGTNGLTLPMYYQTSLGSYDIVAGVSLLSKGWLFAFGYQRALTANENDFNWGEWVRFQDRDYLSRYDVGIGLLRGTDIMFRVEKNFRFVNYSFNFGLLPIYRITPDRGIIRTRNNGGVVETTGLALSALAGFTYHLDVTNSIKFIFGHQIDDRDVNPDGLTRDWVINAIYVYRF